MPLTPEQLTARKIGGSDAPVLMKGDHFGTTPYTLWEVKTGRAEPENMDRKLLVQMGVWTEPHNRDWYMAETGFLVEEVSTIPNPDLPWATANRASRSSSARVSRLALGSQTGCSGMQ